MKVKSISPLIVDACVAYLKDKQVGTKYRPGKNKYQLDTHLMARVIYHNGSLQATVRQDESVLMNAFLKSALEQGVIESITTNNKYKITQKDNANKPTIYVEKIVTFNFRGRKPDLINNIMAEGEKVNG